MSTELPAVPPSDNRLTVCRDFAGLLRRHGLDTFESFYDERTGKLLRDLGQRANLRLTLDASGGKLTFFLKRHEPLGLTEKLKAWLRLARPVSHARTEWENIGRLARLDIPTMQPVVLGEDSLTGRSFLMTAEIVGGRPADDFARERLAGDAAAAQRREFARKLGRLVRKLHAAGMTHRDLYLCHVFVREDDQALRLHLIDLQRVGRRRFRRRWEVKDIAQLEYSRPPGVFSRTDAMRFLHAYFDTPGLDVRQKRFVASVLRKAKRMKKRKTIREMRR